MSTSASTYIKVDVQYVILMLALVDRQSTFLHKAALVSLPITTIARSLCLKEHVMDLLDPYLGH